MSLTKIYLRYYPPGERGTHAASLNLNETSICRFGAQLSHSRWQGNAASHRPAGFKSEVCDLNKLKNI